MMSLKRLRKSALDYISGSSESTTNEPQFQIPSKWLPGFWQSIALGLVVILHTLMVLAQKWSVRFRCLVRFRDCKNVIDATHVHVTPNKHQGKEELVPLTRSGPMNSICSFEFHRRKYIYDGRSNSFVKVRCRVDYPISHYRSWTGISSEVMQNQLSELHGPNAFQISSPQFMDLYIAQITSPFTVFQLFCVLLWCLDEYWRYSLFTLFMICSFEATTVFTRLKSLNTLRGMGNESRKIQLYRMGAWQEGSTTDLLPGDIFSLTKAGDDVIPCDAMIVSGSVVVNEATLTGESVPQMKDGISANCDDGEVVSIRGQHKVHALFGGTRVLQVTSVEEKAAELKEQERDEADMQAGEEKDRKTSNEINQGVSDSVVPLSLVPPPLMGDVCVTAPEQVFSSSQGKLVRMIEHSTAAVGGYSRYGDAVIDTASFALSASGYVLYKGMQDGTRSRYQLLLHCILIVTSVIPPELPMQTALAVNASLMTLMKMQVFCTEPFRVPVAGKVDTCVFDKTGTLTTDELVAVGVVSQGTTIGYLHTCFKDAMKALEEAKNAPPPQIPNPNARMPVAGAAVPPVPVKSTISVAASGLTKMSLASAETTLVLGACHSLVLVDGKVAGDPLEVASLKAVKWELPAIAKDCARPRPATSVKRPLKISTLDSGDINITQAHIVSRHHFSSKLQRMSVVVRMAGDVSGGGWVLVKGSPEVLLGMCVDIPADYKDVASELAKRGMRVIALGIRRLKNVQEVKMASEHRGLAEEKLNFVGFASFTCRVRKDSGDIIKQLRDGGNTVAMATGDAMLTAIHVAREVGITTESKRGILILEEKDSNLVWVNYENDKQHDTFDPSKLVALSDDYDLCVSGGTLNLSLEKYPSIVGHLEKFVVFGRMRPDEKERVLLAMKDHGRVCLMCGDGANDVGALKQAHVGVALLSGFGDMNVDRGDKKEVDKKAVPAIQNKDGAGATSAVTTVVEAEVLTSDQLHNLKLPDLKTKLRLLGVEPDDHACANDRVALIDLYLKTAEKQASENSDVKRHAKLMSMTPQERNKFLAEERKALMQKKQDDFQREYLAMQQRGESWAMFKAMQKVWTDEMSAQKAKAQKENTFTGSAGKMATMMDALNESQAGMEDLELPMVKIGDASVASPFTSKMPSIRGCLDIVRQGRCTLVTTIQMYQILALNCLINAYSLSVLHLDGVKYGDRQMTCLGILMSVSFVTISRAKPLDKLSKVRPLSSVFHPSLFLSIAGQFLLHLFTMHYLVQEGKKYLPEEHKVELEKEFKPNVVNSIVFLVTAVQQVSVFVVNLKGKPFMGGLTENTPLMWSLAITFIGTFLCASESIPQLNSGLQLEPFPSVAFRNLVLGCLIVDVGGALLWDRLMLGLFSFPILKASLSSTTKQDVISMVRVVAIVTTIMYWLATQDYTEIMAELERQEALAAESSQSVPADNSQLLWKSEDL